MVDCPVDGCDTAYVNFDPDAMMGHLMVDHEWNHGDANQWMSENWPPEDEWNTYEPQPEAGK